MSFRDQVNAWLSTITRVVGIGAVVWEVLVDRLKHPEALVIFGTLAGAPDILGALGITISRKKPDDK
jgi:hypothetical protein